MKCYCILKMDHECSEMLDSYEKQYEDNDKKLKIEPNSGPYFGLSPLQLKYRADINGVKLLLPFVNKLDEEQIAHFSAIVSHFPYEFSENERKIMHMATLNMIEKSKKYFCLRGRLIYQMRI